MRPADEFIQLFNELTDHLRKITGTDRIVPFANLVDRAAEKDSAVKRMKDRLKDYGDLRNAIVHHRAYPAEVVAEPTENTIGRLRELLETVRAPRKLDPTFRRPVTVFALTDPLVKVLQVMRMNDFSQVVVRKDGKLDLLTVEGVARWLEHALSGGLVDSEHATVADAHRHDMHGSFLTMARDRTIYDAEEAFSGAIADGRPRLYAIIVTQSGGTAEGPIGIVTPWDLLEDGRTKSRDAS